MRHMRSEIRYNECSVFVQHSETDSAGSRKSSGACEAQMLLYHMFYQSNNWTKCRGFPR